MVYRIGIVGAGHWSKRLEMGIREGHPFEIHKTVDVLSYDEKQGLLEALDIQRDKHYRIQPGDPLPEEFFEGIDVVQIASPIEYHRKQTMESLEQGKLTITEKSYGADQQEFGDVLDYLTENELWSRSYLHLHYLKKLLTMRMPEIVERVSREAGPVRRVEATFIEEYSKEDERRSWLFHPRNGGVFLDWIHPIEVLAWAVDAEFTGLLDADGYLVNPSYTEDHPTAARARYSVDGEFFQDDAEATIRVGKGFRDGMTHKVMRYVFDDSYLDFSYASSEQEFESEYRGEWAWKRWNDSSVEVLDSGRPTGPIPYRFLIREIHDAVTGDGTPLSEDVVRRMYEPVWMYNESGVLDDPVRDRDAVRSFAEDAVDATSDTRVVRR